MTTMLAGAVGAAGTATSASANQVTTAAGPEFYLWRQYILRNGTAPRRLADYLQNAAIPALNRLGHAPIGVFEVVAGVPGPTAFVLTPLPTLDTLATLEGRLEKDADYAKAAAAYLDVTAADPAYVRIETSLLSAFPKFPRLVVPTATAAKGPRLFELRTYESPSEKTHLMKVKMFSELGEIEIFKRVGLTPVFFSRTLTGPRMPSLVYMLVHDDMAAREKSWNGFRTDAEWKKVSSTPGYSDAEIVSNITTLYLRPAAYSQI
jgi:NIPSNAP protein